MKIRLGYVHKPLTLEEYISFKTTTYTSYQKEANNNKLEKIILDNLHTLKEILTYNVKNNIHFFRITSNLIPLATLSEVNFNYIKPYLNEYREIGKIIYENELRVDMHPSQYTVLNSTKKEVLENSIKSLFYHYQVLKAMQIAEPKILLHIGSSTLGKKNSMIRFANNFQKLPSEIRRAIMLENDDKTYNVKDTLELCQKLNIPFVLDYHHHICNPTEENIEYYLNDIIKTWKNQTPKMHFSSPKSHQKKEIRSHHNYINSNDFINFLEILKKQNKDIDIMIEAKEKDKALFKLIRELKYKTNYKFIDETTIEI